VAPSVEDSESMKLLAQHLLRFLHILSTLQTQARHSPYLVAFGWSFRYNHFKFDRARTSP